ncbi:MAG: SAM-dependent methyltransferase [Solirubrobacterales bacterium]
MMIFPISLPWKLDRRVVCGGVLAAGLLAGGCGSNRYKPVSLSVDAAWSPTSARQENAATNPPTLVFVEFVRTPQDVTDQMLKMAHITSSDVVCDLGCGDGRILIAAAKQYGCRAIGYDLDPLRVQEARENAKRQGVSHLVTVEQKNVLTVNLEGVTVVTVYMGTEINARLVPQLSRLPIGARIVSHNFGLGTLRPDEAVEMVSHEDDRRHRLYLWHCPLAVDAN